MSYGKFAPITGTLLARKGDAAPSLAIKRTFGWATEQLHARDISRDLREIPREPVREIPAHTPPDSAHHEVHEPASRPLHAVDKPRRIVVGFNAAEFERLGIAAVKKGVSRHDLVRDTMNEFLQRLAVELNSRCACLNAGETQACGSCTQED